MPDWRGKGFESGSSGEERGGGEIFGGVVRYLAFYLCLIPWRYWQCRATIQGFLTETTARTWNGTKEEVN